MVMRCILVAVLAIVLSASPLCAKELTGTLQQIKTSGKIRVGYRQSLPPMSFLDPEKKPAGYSIDICRLVAEEVERAIGSDITVEYVPVTAENRFAALADNWIDILCGATTKTISRGEVVDFTQLIFTTGAAFMTLKDTHLMNNFEGKKIGVTKGTTTAVTLSKLLEEAKTKAEVVLMDSSADALAALNKGDVDAISADQVVLIGLALTSGQPANYSLLPDLYSYEPLALAVRRNDADFRLVADRVIAALYRTGNILPIYDRWFGRFAPKRSSAFDALIKINAIPE